MRVRSEQWSKLAARGRFTLETKARIGGVDYTAISAPRINRSLMSAPLSIGNCNSATLSLSIMTDDEIRSSSPIVIMGRLTNGQINSEWKEFGTFFINKRDTSYTGLLKIDCFDAMLKANQNYITEFETEVSYPKPMKTVVEIIASRIGVSIDPRTKINTGPDYVISYPSGRTMMQVLGYIGACHGGNWIITEDNLLRLVPLITSPDETFHIIDEDYEKIKTVEGDRLAYMQQLSHNAVLPPISGETPSSNIPISHYITDEYGAKIVTSDGHILVWAEDGSVDATDGLINIPIVCGKLNTGDAVTVTGVSMTDDAGNSYTAGDNRGSMLIVEGNPYATQAICNNLYAAFNGLVYFPYTATKTLYDPAAELGDQVKIGDMVQSVLYSSTLTLDLNFRADISAPNSEELSEEYPYLTESKKTEVLINKVKEQSKINFEINADSISAEVIRAKDAESALSSRVTQNADGITSEVTRAQGAENALSSRITQNANSIKLKVDSGTVSSSLSLENGNVDIEANRLRIDSTNFTLERNGNIVARNISATGTLSSSNSNLEKTQVRDGSIRFYEGSNLLGSLAADIYAQGYDDQSYPVVSLETNGDGLIFSTANAYFFALNNGINTDGYTERFLTLCDSRFRDDVHLSSSLVFDDGDPNGTNKNVIFLSYGTVCTNESAYVGGDLTVIGAKNRAVETNNYGYVGLNAMESTSAVFSDMGSGVIDDTGICEVFFDPCFAETIDSKSDYLVFLTQTGLGTLSYTEKASNFFVVSGTPGTSFDWIIFAKQKGYANTYLDPIEFHEYKDDTVDNSIFMGENRSSVNSEDYMSEFVDTLDKQAEIYLEEYEKEVLGYYGN